MLMQPIMCRLRGYFGAESGRFEGGAEVPEVISWVVGGLGLD